MNTGFPFTFCFFFDTLTGTYTCLDSDVGTIDLNDKATTAGSAIDGQHTFKYIDTTAVYNAGSSVLKPLSIPLIRGQMWSINFVMKNIGYTSLTIGSWSGGSGTDSKPEVRVSTAAPSGTGSIGSWGTAIWTGSKSSGTDATISLNSYKDYYIGFYKACASSAAGIISNIVFS